MKEKDVNNFLFVTARNEIVDLKPKLVLEIDKETLQDIASFHGKGSAKEALLQAISELLKEYET